MRRGQAVHHAGLLAGSLQTVYFGALGLRTRESSIGTYFSLLLFRSIETAILGLWPRCQTLSSPSSWCTGPRPKLGLGGSLIAGALPCLRFGSTWPRQ